MRILKYVLIICLGFYQVQLLSAQELSPYQKITQGAETQQGGVTVHKKDGVYYLEIPKSALGRDIIWYAELGRVPYVSGLLGMSASPGAMINNLVIRLERYQDKIMVRDYTQPLDLRAAAAQDPGTPAAVNQEIMNRVMAETNVPSVVMAFPIVAESQDGGMVINASSIFSKDVEPFAAKGAIPAATFQDPNRSYVDDVKAFDTNIRIRSLLTFGVGPANPLLQALGGVNSSAATVEVVHSLYLLPEKKLMPRLADPRIGYFNTSFTETSLEGGAESKAYISRYRLVKKNPNAEVSEPVEPIVYYIGPNVPPRWRPIFKEAVESWNQAFAEAGFRNAIVAKDPPNDPNWDPNDLGYSVIRWVGQPIANAQGPSVVDPRTGEILSAHVLIWEDVMDLAASWYYFEGSAANPRAQQFPLPKDIQDQLMRYVVAHEVGHSIGLRHNHRASQAFTTEQLRDPAFANKYGPVASIMSYGRINYVAQPGDGVTTLIPQIAPYDHLVIKYGYRPIPGARTPEDEIPTLNKWLEVQRTDDNLLWGAEDEASHHDPMVLTGNVGRDRIEATDLGLKNLQRAMENLPRAIGESPQDVDHIKSMFKSGLDLRKQWLNSVSKELYGVIERRTLDPKEQQYEFVTPEHKREVTAYLLKQLENTTPLITPEIRRIFMPYELSKIIIDSQGSILEGMLMKQIFDGMWDAAVVGGQSYSVASYLDDIEKGLFSELGAASVKVDPVRRYLQSRFVESLKIRVSPPGGKASGGNPDVRGAARLVLQELEARLEMARKKAADIDTRAHLYDLQKEIEEVL